MEEQELALVGVLGLALAQQPQQLVRQAALRQEGEGRGKEEGGKKGGREEKGRGVNSGRNHTRLP